MQNTLLKPQVTAQTAQTANLDNVSQKALAQLANAVDSIENSGQHSDTSKGKSKIFSGLISSDASQQIIKQSKTVTRQKKMTLWTPVLIWPLEFNKHHEKEVIVYNNEKKFHQQRWPALHMDIFGGIIIDLDVEEVEQQIAQLISLENLLSDNRLVQSLDFKISQIRTTSGKTPHQARGIDVARSELFRNLPESVQLSIQSRLDKFGDNGQLMVRGDRKVRKRYAKDEVKRQLIVDLASKGKSNDLLDQTLKHTTIGQTVGASDALIHSALYYKRRSKQIPLSKSPECIAAVLNIITGKYVSQFTVDDVVREIQRSELVKKPKRGTILKIIKDQLALRYNKYNSSSIRYNDIKFNQKRQWVSRLLAQLVHDNVVIVSIDEASFREQQMDYYQWQSANWVIDDIRKKGLAYKDLPKQDAFNDDEQPKEQSPDEKEFVQRKTMHLQNAQAQDQNKHQNVELGLWSVQKNRLRQRISPTKQNVSPTKSVNVSKNSTPLENKFHAMTLVTPAKSSTGLASINKQIDAMRINSTQTKKTQQSHDSQALVPRNLFPRYEGDADDTDQTQQGRIIQAGIAIEQENRQCNTITPAEQLVLYNRKRKRISHSQFSLSLLAAMTQDKVIAMQVFEGGVDSLLFENFIYRLLNKLRTNQETASKHIVLLLDNAAIHKHSTVFETARKMKATILMNAQYSPFLQPVEQLFLNLKTKLRKRDVKPVKQAALQQDLQKRLRVHFIKYDQRFEQNQSS